MKNRQLGTNSVSAIGLGCMGLSHGYGDRIDDKAAERLLLGALDKGVTHFDTASQYGFGHNEELVGRVLSPHRDKFTLASKCGMGPDAQGKREINNHPDKLRQTCEEGLKRLKTDHIDLYYLHRWDKKTPIEESVGALSDLVTAGKIGAIGLSEVSADTLKKGHATHPIAAMQSEYSLWTRNPEISVLETCQVLGTTFVAFSPVARGYLTAKLNDVRTFTQGDLRKSMPRFSPENYLKNLELLERFKQVAKAHECTPAQLALAWLLHRAPDILPIPGTTSLDHLEENMGASNVSLDADSMTQLAEIFGPNSIFGQRYSALTQSEVDTEEFA